jgi:nascent polypeptide-associated complex subunit alpha
MAAAEPHPKIEEVEDDAPDLEPAEEGGDAEGEAGSARGGKQTRNEKKNRKAMARLGMKPVPNVERVTIKKSKTIMFVIAQPDVYKSPATDTYIIFGEAKIEDIESEAAKDALRHFAPPTAAAAPAERAAAPAEEGGEEVDASGVDEKDIELVIAQAGVSRGRAVTALKNSGGDIVAAIMELTN